MRTISCVVPLRRLGVAALLAAAVLLVQFHDSAARVFDPEYFTLTNGMQVVVITNARAPIVTHMVWYKVGAADEAAGESGNAHLLEHLMFKGTKTMEPGEFSRLIAKNGGQENAFTSYDYTAYYQTVAKDRLELVMKHEADRMQNLVLTEDLVVSEREVVIEERRSRVENDPASRLRETMQAVLYLNHPYRIPVIGWQHEIAALNAETALAFYRRWYAPNNAILIVAGDVTAAEVRPLADKYYGEIPARPVPSRLRETEPPQTAARRVTLESAEVRQPGLAITYLAPSYNSPDSEHAYALEVLDEILGGGTASRLYRTLVVEKGLAAGVNSAYSPSALDLSSFDFSASPRLGVAIEKVEAAIRAEIARLLQDGVSEEEVATAKRRLAADAIYARDSLNTAPNVFGRALTTGSSVADVEAWPDRIAAVTSEQVMAAARAVFRDENSVTGLLLPEPTS